MYAHNLGIWGQAWANTVRLRIDTASVTCYEVLLSAKWNEIVKLMTNTNTYTVHQSLLSV